MKIYVLFIFLAMGTSLLGADETQSLSMHQLVGYPERADEIAMWDNSEVLIRGFLYEKADGTWILASEPDLKTCCVGSTDKITKQIALSSDFEGGYTSYAVNMKGQFRVVPKKNAEGKLIHLYELHHPTLVKNDNKKALLYTVLTGGIGSAVAITLLIQHKRRQS